MQESINLTIATKSGEDLYVRPYVYCTDAKHINKWHYYRSPEFEVRATANYLQNMDEHIIKNYWLKKYSIKTFYSLKEWFEVTFDRLSWFFGKHCFDRSFKDRTIDLYFSYFKHCLEASYVFNAASVFPYNISLRGQLYIESDCEYVDDYYLTPTAQYFNVRLEEWLNEDLEEKYIGSNEEEPIDRQLIKYQRKLREDYKNWRDYWLSKGEEIDYLYSLNT